METLSEYNKRMEEESKILRRSGVCCDGCGEEMLDLKQKSFLTNSIYYNIQCPKCLTYGTMKTIFHFPT